MAASFQPRHLDPVNSRGMEIFEITPVILGGNPNDPANKILLDRKEHMQAVVYWNRVIKGIRENPEASAGDAPGSVCSKIATEHCNRYGRHEMNPNKPNLHHYHLETWFGSFVFNVLQRISG